MTRKRMIENETLDDKKGEVILNALLKAPVDTPARIEVEWFWRDSW